MGQILSHGVYLPNEGERNCYAGLASNWQILNTAVGAIAEKAPLVHTHTVSQITDFPAYGNAAGTICEGNDSRLSDARTPVAHTHGKSDITDLFNSANTWSGNNTFTGRTSYIGIYDKFQTTAFDVRTDPESTRGGDIFRFWSGTGSTYGDYLGGMSFNQDTDGSSRLQLICFGYPTTGNAKQNRINFHAFRDGSSSFYPVTNKEINLGTSTNKWKTLNGINPGALSFPKVDGWNSGQDIDAVGIDTTNWDMSGGSWNELTNNVHDGWVYFAFQGCSASDRITVRYYGTDSRYITLGFAPLSTGYIYCAFPLAKGFKANIAFTTSGSVMTKFIYPCLGNV